MANPNPNTSGLVPPVRTTEEARALAALSSGRKLERETVKRQVVLFADQEDELERRGIKNRSEWIRQAIDEKLGRE